MRIYYSLLVILTLSCFLSLSIINSPSPNISKHLINSYFSEQNLPLRISFVICTSPLYWDLFRSAYSHKFRAFHVGTFLLTLTNLLEILIWLAPHYCFGFFFTFREIVFLIGFFSIIFHHRNIINLRVSNIICVALWSFGFISGALAFSFHQTKALLSIPVIPISMAMILAIYDYFKFLCDPRHEKSLLNPAKGIISPTIIHSDYSFLIFLFSFILAASHIYFFCTLYLPHDFSFSIRDRNGRVDDDHVTGPALQVHGTITLVIAAFVNIYPYLMVYRDMEVALMEQKDFYRNLGHEIRTPLNTALMGLQLIHEVINSPLRDKQLPSLVSLPSEGDTALAVPHEVRHLIHPELVQEYLQLKFDSQVLYNSRVRSSHHSDGSLPSARVPLGNGFSSLHSAYEDDEHEKVVPVAQQSPLHKDRPAESKSFVFPAAAEKVTNIVGTKECVAEISPYIDDVLASCETAIDVLNEMLLYETLSSGNVTHEFKPFPILRLVLDPLAHFRIQVCLSSVSSPPPTTPDLSSLVRPRQRIFNSVSQLPTISRASCSGISSS
jgi:signal transduction histidine kinase